MAIRSAVSADGGSLVVAVEGTLDLSDVVPLRTRLMKCLAEQPDALLIDLSGMAVGEPLALALFTVVVRQAARWPGTPVLLCAPPSKTRALLRGGAYRRLPVFASMAAAGRHAGQQRHSLPTVSDELLPITGAPREARDVATDACLRWDLPKLVAPASLITSELVSNVIDHAQTMMTLRLSLHGRYLHIAVRDGSTVPPVLPNGAVAPDAKGGRGLFLVGANAHSWGWLPTEGGKVVWASLSV